MDAPACVGIQIKAKLQRELDTMENDGSMRNIEHHTIWCSSITTSVKKGGYLRVCLDPKRLNDNLKRCTHTISTLAEPNLVFSKMDAKTGYCMVYAVARERFSNRVVKRGV